MNDIDVSAISGPEATLPPARARYEIQDHTIVNVSEGSIGIARSLDPGDPRNALSARP